MLYNQILNVFQKTCFLQELSQQQRDPEMKCSHDLLGVYLPPGQVFRPLSVTVSEPQGGTFNFAPALSVNSSYVNSDPWVKSAIQY